MTLLPIVVKRIDDKELYIKWNDGHESTYDCKELRKACPCAMCDSYRKEAATSGETKLLVIKGPVTNEAKIVRMTYVGRYAIQFTWNDGHDTGIYSFETLREICGCKDCLMKG